MSHRASNQPETPVEDCESLLDRFDCQWQDGEPPTIEDYLSDLQDTERTDALIELIKIDLEYRWRGAAEQTGENGKSGETQATALEDYVERFTDLGPLQELPTELIAEEYRARRRWGDAPQHEEYARRFGPDRRDVVEALKKIDGDLDGTKRVAPGATTEALTMELTDAAEGTLCFRCGQPLDIAHEHEVVPFNQACPGCGSMITFVDRAGEVDTAAVAAEETTRTRLGRFELIEHVGRGTFGDVWRARDPELDRDVAIKIPRRADLPEDQIDRFRKEARLAARLRHPYIVAVYEVGQQEDAGIPVFIVTEFVEGQTLDVLLREDPLPVEEAARLCHKIAVALDHAHGKSIVHRDLKPGNILIDKEGEPRITDFGLAKLQGVGATVTLEGQVLGTAAYISPEQAEGKGHQSDGRSDLYSLGTILYEMLNGRRPFEGDVPSLLYHAVNTKATFPDSPPRQIPKGLRDVCLKCLEKQPDGRYATSRELADELNRFLQGEELQETSVASSSLDRMAVVRSWCQKNWMVLSVVAVLAVVLGVLAPLFGPDPSEPPPGPGKPAVKKVAPKKGAGAKPARVDSMFALAKQMADVLISHGQTEVTIGAFDGPVDGSLIEHRLKVALQQQRIGSLDGPKGKKIPLYLRVTPLARWRVSGDFYEDDTDDGPAVFVEAKVKGTSQGKSVRRSFKPMILRDPGLLRAMTQPPEEGP